MKGREIGRNSRPSILNEAENATLVQRPNINYITYSIYIKRYVYEQ